MADSVTHRLLPVAPAEGWWLSADYGVARSGDHVASWASRGGSSPVFVAAASGLAVAAEGVVFPGIPDGFLREGAPLAAADDYTVFGLVRIDEPRAGMTIIGRDGGWWVGLGVDGAPCWRIAGPGPDGGHAAPAEIPFGPPAPDTGFAYFVIRKRRRTGKWWWNGILEGTLAIERGPRAAGGPITIGGSDGTSAGAGFAGCIRDLGCYDRALDDGEVEMLLDWLSARRPPFSLSWGSTPLAGPYPEVRGGAHAVVLAPNGAEPVEGDIASHRYHHHSRVAVHDGRIWVAYSSGCVGEDASGQMVAASWSGDGGQTWSAARCVVPPQSRWRRPDDPECPGYQPGTRICYPRAFVRHAGTLYLVAAVDAVNGLLDLEGAALVAAACLDDGSIGRLFRVSSAAYPALLGAAPIAYDERLGPALLREADFGGHWGGSTPGNPASAWTGWLLYHDVSFAEPATVPLDPHAHRLLRLWRRLSRGNRVRLYATLSEDGGGSFSPPFRLSVPNAPSSVAALRLADGRIALVGNPMDGATNRDPLYLAIFDAATGAVESVQAVRQGLSGAATYPGWHKHGAASYPAIAQDGDTLYISYSINKETIALTRLPLPPSGE